jgi:hypothetical protein
MQQQVFVSHAGPDSERARLVALALEQAGLGVVLDRNVNRPGDDFLAFMEKSLSECDYCLLLWSSAAADRDWVRVEWEAALYRTIKGARRFLVVGRLEEYQLPALLAPRLFIDLFPELTPGIDELIAMCQHDRAAAAGSRRPIGQPTADVAQDVAGNTVYVTSDLFQLTIPLSVSLDVPVGVYVDRLVFDLELPRQYDHQGLLGVRYHYSFAHEGQRLARDRSLAAQHVDTNSILWLEVEMTAFAAGTPFEGVLPHAKFRGGDDSAEAYRGAHNVMLAAVARVGLRQ